MLAFTLGSRYFPKGGAACSRPSFRQRGGGDGGGGGEGLRSRATGFWLERSIRHWWGGAGGHTAGRRGGGDPAATSGGGAVAAVASFEHPLDSNKAVSWTLIRCEEWWLLGRGDVRGASAQCRPGST